MLRLGSSALAVLACVTLLITVDCQSSDTTASTFVGYTDSISPSKVDWRNWEAATFAEAEKSDRLLFLYLTNAWCVPCNRMETLVLSDDSISSQLERDYVPIRIDADRYPNLYDRYQLGGYPSCIVLTPDARIVGGTNYLSKDSLSLFLTRINNVWKENRPLIMTQADRLHTVFLQTLGRRSAQQPSEVALMLAETIIDRQYDSTYGGFGDQPKFPLPIVNEYMFGASDPAGGLMFKNFIAQTMDAQLALLDTVWGGFYRYASFADWSGASHEKLLDVNAQLLSNYLDMYLLSHDKRYRQVAESIIGYLDRFLRSSEGWGFCNSQQGAVLVQGQPIDPQEYFRLSDKERVSRGVPAVDKAVYTEPNCLAIRAYLKAGRALGRQDCSDYAIKTLDQILLRAVGADGAVCHDPVRTKQSAVGQLPDQVATIMALMDAYETSGKREYVSRAEGIAQFVVKRLIDHDSGGAHYEVSVAGNPGRMGVALKPFYANADAVIAFIRLYHHTGKDEYRQEADGILKYLFMLPMREDDLRLCKLASAYVWYSRVPLTFVMIGAPGEAYHSLLQSAWRTYFPRLVVLHFDPATDKLQSGKLQFPSTDKPTLYVCLDTLRSAAIDDTSTTIARIKEFLRPKPAEPDTTK